MEMEAGPKWAGLSGAVVPVEHARANPRLVFPSIAHPLVVEEENGIHVIDTSSSKFRSLHTFERNMALEWMEIYGETLKKKFHGEAYRGNDFLIKTKRKTNPT